MATGYISGTDFILRFSEARLKAILNLGDNEDLQTNSQFMTAISDANSHAATFIMAAYPKTPIRTPPAILVRMTCLVALRCLYDFKEINISEENAKRFEEVDAWFQALGRGEVDLPNMSKADDFDAIESQTVSIDRWTENNFEARQYGLY